MPVHKVKGGYKFGSHGKVYRGKGAKAKAARQGRAIRASGWKGK
jgi:tRNA splicing endonuclease